MIIPMSSAIVNSGCLSDAWTKAYAQAAAYQDELSRKYDGEWFKVEPVEQTVAGTIHFTYIAMDASGLKFDPNLDNYTYLKYKEPLQKWLTKLYKKTSDCSDIFKGYSYSCTLDGHSEAFATHKLSLRSMRTAMKAHHYYKVSFVVDKYPYRIISEELQRLFRCLSAETGFKHIEVKLLIDGKPYGFTSDMSKNYIDSVLEEVL